MNLSGRWPAEVVSYAGDPREARVSIPGLTDGAEDFPIAKIEYPIGDKSKHTEIRILPGDTVWVDFERGDPRYPVITGYRNPEVGNVVSFRRWHSENIETDADQTQKHTAGTSYTVDSGQTVYVKAGATIVLEAGSSITLKVGGSTLIVDAGTIKLNAGQILLNS